VLTQGQENDVWSASPQPVRVRVDRIREDGTRERHARLEVAQQRFSMGTDGVASFELNGFDAEDQRVVWGRSYPMDTPTLRGYALPLFVSRTGVFSRPPEQLRRNHGELPPVALLGARFVLVAGRAIEGMLRTEAYDLALWRQYEAPELRCPVAEELCEMGSLAVVDYGIIVAVADRWLRSYLYRPSESSPFGVDVETYDAPLPEGLNEFSEVAGGRVVSAPDGDVYLIGATRPDEPSSAVLRMLAGEADTAELTLRTLQLGIPRAGAAATWVEGMGLVVAGGSAEGAGVELLAEGQAEFQALPFPPDPTTVAAVTALGDSTLLRVGGLDAAAQPAQTVTLDLQCQEQCEPQFYADAVQLQEPAAFTLPDADVLAVGLDPDGQTQVVRLGPDRIDTVVLREPRRGASALSLSTGHVAVLGGLLADDSPAGSLELYAP
jgi:hypothetical protein